MTPAKACPSCGQVIFFATTKNGRALPLNEEPDDHGNVLLVGEEAHVLTQAELVEARMRGAHLFVPHFASCPKAAQHRKVRR